MEQGIIYPAGYITRRFFNWVPMGLAYAFLYWGRYNITVAKSALGALMSNEAFGTIFGVGAWIYAVSFLVNGPLADRYGGRRMMLIAAFFSGFMNLIMGLIVQDALVWHALPTDSLTTAFCIAYGINMYFQSIGAVAIVKVNAPWFHVKERGSFGFWFGAMISTGLFFAFDVSTRILGFAEGTGPGGVDAKWWVFYAPALGLFAIFAVEYFLLKDTPKDAGFEVDIGQKEADADGRKTPVLELYKSILTNKVIWVVCFIGVCTGVLRNGVMHWIPIYAKGTMESGALALPKTHFLNSNWGLVLLAAGILGPFIGGKVRDKIFGARNGPPGATLYAIAIIATIAMVWCLDDPIKLMIAGFFISVAAIGSQGLMTATAAMDFGGKARGTATGVIDAFVYVGAGIQSLSLGAITESKHWEYWPRFMIPFAIVGFLLCLKIWNAKAASQTGGSAH